VTNQWKRWSPAAPTTKSTQLGQAWEHVYTRCPSITESFPNNSYIGGI